MRVLFDQNIPRNLRQFLPGHDIRTAAEMGWSALSNGLILDAAEAAGFHVMITADRNMRHQQNMTGRRIAVLIMSNNNRRMLEEGAPHISRALEGIVRALLRKSCWTGRDTGGVAQPWTSHSPG